MANTKSVSIPFAYAEQVKVIAAAMVQAEGVQSFVVKAIAAQLKGFSPLSVDSEILKQLVEGIADAYKGQRGGELDKAARSHLKVVIVAVTHGYTAPEGAKQSLSNYAQQFRHFVAAVFNLRKGAALPTDLGACSHAVSGMGIGGYVPKVKAKPTNGKVEKWTMPKSKSAQVAALLALAEKLELKLTPKQQSAIA